jgi:dephospho-CoA kinase
MSTPMTLENKYIVGVTGGIGCGKTTVTDLFAAKGVDIVDADVVARETVIAGSRGLKELVEAFGNEILNEQGTLNRAALREIVFDNKSAKEKVNAILHPLIRDAMLSHLHNTKSRYCMLSAPLLFENNLQVLVNRCLVVDVTKAQQLERTLSRDGGKQSTIESIIAAQVTRETRLSLANDIIDNTKSQSMLVAQVDELHKKYTKLASASS